MRDYRNMEKFDRDRREFIWSLGRYLLLGGLGAVSGGLIFKRVMASDEQKCVEPNVCRSCSVFDKCDLPKALTARKETVIQKEQIRISHRISRKDTENREINRRLTQMHADI